MPSFARRLLLSLILSAVATSALAVTRVVSDGERAATRQEIIGQLGPAHYYALVIGISEFDNAAWRHLDGVGPEIQKVGAALSAQGFTIVPESHTGRMDHAALKAAIERFFSTYGGKAEDRLVVYIATHGYADPSRPDADGFLVASDAGAPAAGGAASARRRGQVGAAHLASAGCPAPPPAAQPFRPATRWARRSTHMLLLKPPMPYRLGSAPA